jgi:hypothetical protein
MSEVAAPVGNPPPAQAQAPARERGPNRVAELKVSGHLMTLDTGLFCVFQAPGSPPANEASGLPGVRISLPPGATDKSDVVSISTFRDDGWLNGSDSAALIRVANGPAQVLVTVYQAPTATPDSAPRLQVMRLGADPAAEARASAEVAAPGNTDIVAHVQRTGDLPSRIGEWTGTRGSRLWIEGFGVTPHSEGLKPEDLEYQGVLGRGWLSPWIEGGKFCGSRGMALPLLGLKVRLKGAAAKRYDCSYSATFVDGSAVGPVPAGEACEAESLAALEAFQIVIARRGGASVPEPVAARPRAGQPAPAAAARTEPDRSAPGKAPARAPRPGGGGRRPA